MKTDIKTGEKILTCPRCEKNMKKLIKKNVVIDVCRKCGGMWVDAGEMEKLAEMMKHAPEGSGAKEGQNGKK